MKNKTNKKILLIVIVMTVISFLMIGCDNCIELEECELHNELINHIYDEKIEEVKNCSPGMKCEWPTNKVIMKKIDSLETVRNSKLLNCNDL